MAKSNRSSQSVHATNLPANNAPSATIDGPANWIPEHIAAFLRELGVAVGKLAKAQSTADLKSVQLKAQKRQVAGSESNEEFLRTGGKWKVAASALTEEEHVASLAYAWFDHVVKGEKHFGECELALPKRLRCLPHVFPAAVVTPAEIPTDKAMIEKQMREDTEVAEVLRLRKEAGAPA